MSLKKSHCCGKNRMKKTSAPLMNRSTWCSGCFSRMKMRSYELKMRSKACGKRLNWSCVLRSLSKVKSSVRMKMIRYVRLTRTVILLQRMKLIRCARLNLKSVRCFRR